MPARVSDSGLLRDFRCGDLALGEARATCRDIAAGLAQCTQNVTGVELRFKRDARVWGSPLLKAVKAHGGLKHLMLCGGNPIANAAVIAELGEMKELRSLHVLAGDFSGGLGDTLELFPALARLSLQGADLATVESVAKKQSITDLRLDDADFSGDAMELLAVMPNLERLAINMAEGCEGVITSVDVNRLSENPALRSLEITGAPEGFAFPCLITRRKRARGAWSSISVE